MTPTPPQVAGEDVTVVAGQLGREPHTMSAVALRCPFGYPAVVEDLPYDGVGRPFPTLYYCTCPTLVAAVARLESAGRVASWTTRLAECPGLARSAARAAADEAERRVDLVHEHGLTMLDGGASLSTGVGGVSDLLAVKCLHAHAAHALALPGYALGDAVLAELEDPWCDDRRCAAFLPGLLTAGEAGRQDDDHGGAAGQADPAAQAPAGQSAEETPR